MKISFSKYQASGNDFIFIDNRNGSFNLSRAQIARLCNRKFGIGGDGLILLNSNSKFDFQMVNYNSDGGECTMCGNGGRSIVHFARDLGIQKEHYRFLAVDGEHEANFKTEQVDLKMSPVNGLVQTPAGITLDTGSPHLVVFASDLLNLDVVHEGRKLRSSSLFMPLGMNVNFVEKRDDHLFIRTYERGVEDETLSCGTGAIASAMVSRLQTSTFGKSQEVMVRCQGGELKIRFKQDSETTFSDIWLSGETKKVFEGTLSE